MDTFRPSRGVSLLLASLAAAACLATTAQAHDSGADVHQLKVRYNDLDVGTVGGATALYHRIQGAAHFVCGEEGRSLDDQTQWRSCVRAAVADAVNTVHSPILSAIDSGARPMQTALLRR